MRLGNYINKELECLVLPPDAHLLSPQYVSAFNWFLCPICVILALCFLNEIFNMLMSNTKKQHRLFNILKLWQDIKTIKAGRSKFHDSTWPPFLITLLMTSLNGLCFFVVVFSLHGKAFICVELCSVTIDFWSLPEPWKEFRDSNSIINITYGLDSLSILSEFSLAPL